MAKKMKIILAAVAVIVLCAIFYGTMFSSADSELSMEEVRSLISQQYPGEIKELGLDSSEDDPVYHALIESHGNMYDLLLDARTGEVLQLKVTKSDAAAGTGDMPDESGEDTGNTADEDGQRKESKSMLTEEEAVSIALEEFPGKRADVELDEEDGRQIYEIDIENGEDEATVEIDAYTGEVLKLEIDKDDD